MKIRVTDLSTNNVAEYEFSRNNWRNEYACMKNGLVHMWAPNFKGCSVVVTSGRRWELIKC